MNGRKSKMIRKLAGVTKETQDARKYFGEKSSVRNKVVHHPRYLGTDGRPMVVAKHTTATYKLHQNPRVLAKMLKSHYKKTKGVGLSA